MIRLEFFLHFYSVLSVSILNMISKRIIYRRSRVVCDKPVIAMIEANLRLVALKVSKRMILMYACMHFVDEISYTFELRKVR